MRRAALSIPSNIAEGYGRKTTPDYLRSLYIAYGSTCELETQISLSGETFEEHPILAKYKEGDNFNHRNTWSISRIGI